MTIKTKLREYVELANNGDEEGAKAAFHDYATSRVREMLYGIQEGSEEQLDEISGIQLDGDQLLVNGKSVGTVTSDMEDNDSAITFTESDSEKGEAFADLDSLYEYITNKFNIREGRVEDAVLHQKAMKPMRAARWASVRGPYSDGDGTPGDYDGGGDLGKYADPIKGGSDEAHPTDKNLKNGSEGYDSHDVRSKHGDPVRGASGEAAHSVDKDLKVGSEGYDSHDVRKQHGS